LMMPFTPASILPWWLDTSNSCAAPEQHSPDYLLLSNYALTWSALLCPEVSILLPKLVDVSLSSCGMILSLHKLGSILLFFIISKSKCMTFSHAFW
jgi:hypothetical protein